LFDKEEAVTELNAYWLLLPNLIIATGNPTVKTSPIKIIKIPIGERISTPCPVCAKSIFLTN